MRPVSDSQTNTVGAQTNWVGITTNILVRIERCLFHLHFQSGTNPEPLWPEDNTNSTQQVVVEFGTHMLQRPNAQNRGSRSYRLHNAAMSSFVVSGRPWWQVEVTLWTSCPSWSKQTGTRVSIKQHLEHIQFGSRLKLNTFRATETSRTQWRRSADLQLWQRYMSSAKLVFKVHVHVTTIDRAPIIVLQLTKARCIPSIRVLLSMYRADIPGISSMYHNKKIEPACFWGPPVCYLLFVDFVLDFRCYHIICVHGAIVFFRWSPIDKSTWRRRRNDELS